ncbi:hypothetical protein A3F08_01015 [Candidatus Berkelbacteria bacterium RIFCSPHIGHO2_12_FULL_36_9]|uniref:Uncharacterized protein n=1 Tax=Candidatus Berkelbacteria bacterium RIFCSPHIGHO2_12_FULL_36_9 TaxID=1797469 RepID=A0A1F5EEZ2_9BACT|nr:MAG: hypothetical protein A3F08_01015 [Candidatus Berkelbacteria bacterium RIFCSPHIGHO2_12_FULL_36_9]
MDLTQPNEKEESLEKEPVSREDALTPAQKDFGESWKAIDNAADTAEQAVKAVPGQNTLTKEMKSMAKDIYVVKADKEAERVKKIKDTAFDMAMKNIQELVEKTSHFPFREYINKWKSELEETANGNQEIITEAQKEMTGVLSDAKEKLVDVANLGPKIEETGEKLIAKAKDKAETNTGIDKARDTIAKS